MPCAIAVLPAPSGPVSSDQVAGAQQGGEPAPEVVGVGDGGQRDTSS